MKPGPWLADAEGTIKRQVFDEDGNPAGWELLDGEYPREWAAATDTLEVCRAFVVARSAYSLELSEIERAARAAIAKAAGE